MPFVAARTRVDRAGSRRTDNDEASSIRDRDGRRQVGRSSRERAAAERGAGDPIDHPTRGRVGGPDEVRLVTRRLPREPALASHGPDRRSAPLTSRSQPLASMLPCGRTQDARPSLIALGSVAPLIGSLDVSIGPLVGVDIADWIFPFGLRAGDDR